MTGSHALRLTVLAAVRGFAEPALRSTIFRTAENNNQGLTGNVNLIVHTGPAFNPAAQQAAQKRDRLSLRPARQGGR
jgi:hypothetical protein